MSASFLRCGHCRGFYELAESRCRYCGKDVPLRGADGQPRVYLDRATCRAIQIAEYEQLPPEAHEDCFQPDPTLLDKRCYCLHCGPERPPFEAVEMRWMENEQMWACPCTTCGGRGFTFDVHLAERLWQCAQCQHWYRPANGDFRGSNAKCPKCGCRIASGWFDDETDEDEAAAEEAEQGLDELETLEATRQGEPPAGEEEAMPWTDEEHAEWKAEDVPGMDYMGGHPTSETMQDDIDFPRPGRPKREKGEWEGPEGDIPF